MKSYPQGRDQATQVVAFAIDGVLGMRGWVRRNQTRARTDTSGLLTIPVSDTPAQHSETKENGDG